MNYPEATIAVVKELWQFVINGFSYQASAASGHYAPAHFENGVIYSANHEVTTKVRLLLTGDYSEIDILRPLQQSEYISFYLMERSVVLRRPAKHWTPGSWHTRVKGMANVHISITPTSGSVMEYFDDNHDGKLGIVTAVSSEETITFKSVGLYTEGEIETHELPKSFWQELRPVFITFNTVE